MFEESQDGGSTFRLLDSLAFVRCLVKGLLSQEFD